MSFTETMDHVAQLFEAIGAAVLLAGLFLSADLASRAWRRSKDGRIAYKVLRESFGGVILLGLEILVAADLVRTVAVAPTLENVAILGVIVLIRTFLSFSLEIEIEIDGVVPGGGQRQAAPTSSPVPKRSARRQTLVPQGESARAIRRRHDVEQAHPLRVGFPRIMERTRELGPELIFVGIVE